MLAERRVAAWLPWQAVCWAAAPRLLGRVPR